jgi:hypothetical protein
MGYGRILGFLSVSAGCRGESLSFLLIAEPGFGHCGESPDVRRLGRTMCL